MDNSFDGAETFKSFRRVTGRPAPPAMPVPRSTLDLTGLVALVTGASSGIGRATAVELARRGARVAINYPDPEARTAAETTLRRVQEAAALVAEPPLLAEVAPAYGPDFHSAGDGAGTAPVGLLVEADVSYEGAVERMFERVEALLGPVDVLVNNAGIQIPDEASHLSEVGAFDRVLAVNLRGPYLCARRAIRRWLETGRTGTIVNVSSVHERIPRPHYLSYAVSKFGLAGLTQTLALEYADRGIRVNAVGPGATRTPIQSWLGDEAQTRAVAARIPMQRIAEPEEIARAIAWLASPEAAYVTGQTLFIDGGLTLYPAFREPWSG